MRCWIRASECKCKRKIEEHHMHKESNMWIFWSYCMNVMLKISESAHVERFKVLITKITLKCIIIQSLDLFARNRNTSLSLNWLVGYEIWTSTHEKTMYYLPTENCLLLLSQDWKICDFEYFCMRRFFFYDKKHIL